MADCGEVTACATCGGTRWIKNPTPAFSDLAPCPDCGEVETPEAAVEAETISWRGHQFTVADARFDESPFDTGSHWHLTLVEVQGEQTCPDCGGEGGRYISNDPDPGQSWMRCRGCWGRGIAEIEPLENAGWTPPGGTE